MTTLGAALGAVPAREGVVAALAAGLGTALRSTLAPSSLSPDETALVAMLVGTKYGAEDWTAHGQLPRPVNETRAAAAR
jgi:hypothetical protein